MFVCLYALFCFEGIYLHHLYLCPQAFGSRFEDPLWWKYLSWLKPMGLNAMLTCGGSNQLSLVTTDDRGIHAGDDGNGDGNGDDDGSVKHGGDLSLCNLLFQEKCEKMLVVSGSS